MAIKGVQASIVLFARQKVVLIGSHRRIPDGFP
jgi:hypothetical protein